ncbi:MAG: Daunorubicin/doxorubicin resistance ATP-binding protein DrrA [Syntrophorhabdaceae bacterium PtaU1.Bin034]|jgi:ABC-2 type transport system ATP-binding protein|nr:MAG: Daunorubicin/doxorubicin resistance ATP-binding protein DrrA [Syntrophorhabdaceae bacterium PtaU1.Bin034]
MDIVEVNQLTKKYGGLAAVDRISFSVRAGEIFGFLGPNGAGKTTTINLLTGLARPTSGTATIAGFDCSKEIKKAQQVMGIVPDESNLYEEMDGFENLSFCASLYGMRKEEREKKARELLRQFGLAETGMKPFRVYSKGMKRKLTIAAAIIHDPKILFLDEPTTGIDVASARQIRELIQTLNQKGTTIFLTTHYIEEAERLCSRVAFIVGGKIVRIGQLEELMREVQQENIVQLAFANGVSDLKSALQEGFPDVVVEAAGNDGIRLRSARPLNLTPLMRFFEQKDVTVYEARVMRPSLEEVFVKITGIALEKMKQEKEGKGKQ